MNPSHLSRRDFLKLSGLGLAGLFAPPLMLELEDPFASLQGRVTARTIWLHEKPSVEAGKVKLLQQDAILDIANTALSDDTTAHNRVWYQIGTEGYAYSGNIQPVRTAFNTPQTDIQKQGLLAEVSVPFTDALLAPHVDAKFIYRIYYETTHWVKKAVTDGEGRVWYQIRDDKWNRLYYVRAEHLRILTPGELAPISPDIPEHEKKIVVRLGQQITIAYEYDRPVFIVPVATGGVLRVGTYTTPQGNFITSYKRPSRRMAAGDIASTGFDLPGVPWVQYITTSGIAFHGTYWHNDFGRPRSHGCINLSSSAAKWLYRWTSPQVAFERELVYGRAGTRVEIVA